MSILNGTILLLTLALIAAVKFLPRTARARNAAPIVANHPKACDATACTVPGYTPVTRRHDGTSVRACHGHYAEGIAKGWWTS